MNKRLNPYTPEHDRVYFVLVACAKKKTTISYSDLVRKAKLKLDMSVPFDRGEIGRLLGEISWNESLLGRPMLSSVAIHAGSCVQGQGFFELAEEIYGKRFHNEDEKLDFEMKELSKTFDYWAVH